MSVSETDLERGVFDVMERLVAAGPTGKPAAARALNALGFNWLVAWALVESAFDHAGPQDDGAAPAGEAKA